MTITNNATVNVSGTAGRYMWGIGAEGLSQTGGNNASDGGNGALVDVTNSRTVTVRLDGATSSITSGVRGISATSIGGDAYVASEDNTDSGGKGGGAKEVTLRTTGDVSVTATGLTQPQSVGEISGAIVAMSIGGKGGDGPQTVDNNQRGGMGGYASTSDGTTTSGAKSYVDVEGAVTSSGDYVNGVVALSIGGTGGAGRESSDGGYGGFAGEVEVHMLSATVQTDGRAAIGALVANRGGDGGAFEDSSGLVDFGSDMAGNGQNGDKAKIDGFSSTTTSGDYATGIAVQSLGGLGGGATQGFAFVNTGKENAAQGGKGGTADYTLNGTVSTSGDYADGIVLQSIGGGGGLAGSARRLVRRHRDRRLRRVRRGRRDRRTAR